MATRRKKTQPTDGLTTDRQAGAPVKAFASTTAKKPATDTAPATTSETTGDVTSPAQPAAEATITSPAKATTPTPAKLDLADVLRMRPPMMKVSPTSVRISTALKRRITDQINEFTQRYPEARPPSQSDVINAAIRYYVTSLEEASDAGNTEAMDQLWMYWGLPDVRLGS